MNLELSLKTQNVRSFNLSENGLSSMKTKIKATMLEGDDILLLTNTQIGRNRRIIEKEFLIGGENPYVIYTNSSASDARGVLIAIKLQADIQVIDTAKDDEDRILILKIAKGNETLTIGCVYDDNRNNTRTLTKIEELLDRLDAKQGLIIAGDYNVIINEDLDQFGYENHHHRTRAVKVHKDWEKSGSLIDIYRKKFKNGKAITYVPDTEQNRENPKLGRRLDKFLVSEDLNIKESEIIHISDYHYKTQLNMKKKFDHGAVRLLYNKKKPDIGPGQFKLDPYLVSCGALDSVIKEVIYEANIYNSNVPEIVDAYTERNKIAIPLMNKLIEIQKQRKQEENPAIREEEEAIAIETINTADEKLPTISQLQEINKENADRILTEIQNGIITRVKQEQVSMKKAASHELKDLIRKLSDLNSSLEKDNDDDKRKELLETRELYNTKYEQYFKKEAAKTTLFRQLNLEKPTKWFLNLSSDKQSTDSPSNKLRKYCDKYKDTDEWGKKYDKPEEMQNDLHDAFKKIFDARPRGKNVSIENFLKEIASHPETMGKKLTDTEKQAADEEISMEELQETLEDAKSGKTPGTDGVDKEFLTRFWNMIGKTIYYAQKTFIENEKLNEFLESGIIKVLQKGGTNGELVKDWRPITLLSQIYKLISGVVAKRIKKHLGKLISGCQKAYQNTNNIGEIILDVLEIIAISNFHKKPGMILLIDFSKAFDSINHEFIYESLNFFNFGPYFVKIVKTMLNSRKCNLMIDGYPTKQFRILRRVPQGDTASPYIFILVLEILLLRIKHDPTLKFLKFNVPGFKPMDGGDLQINPLKCFADDMTAIMEETKENLLKMKEIFEAFKQLSGLEINKGKTKVIRIGSNLDNVTPMTDKV